jgi:hypothetical protein
MGSIDKRLHGGSERCGAKACAGARAGLVVYQTEEWGAIPGVLRFVERRGEERLGLECCPR